MRIAAGFAAALVPLATTADTLRVPDDFGSIQAAIEDAEPGDDVLVAPGTYPENLVLRTDVDVRGEETARTFLAPDDGDEPVVSAVGVTGARVSSITVIDAAIGVLVQTSAGIEITNVVFDRPGTAVTVDGISSVDVTNNVFFGADIAISRGSALVAVENNIFAGNGTTVEAVLLPGVDVAANVRSNCFFGNGGPGQDGVVGTAFTTGDPQFVDPGGRDFHLREASECIDVGRGTDVIDGSVADAGVYGGPLADPRPFPVGAPALTATGTEPGPLGIEVRWDANLDYRVTNAAVPGGYRVHYKRGGEAAPPFDGTEAGGGTAPSPIDAGNVTVYLLENLDAGTTVPLAPRLLSAEGRNESVILTWEPSADATGYRIYYGIAAVDEHVVDAGSGTSHAVTGLANGTSYRFAVSAVNQPVYHVAVTAVDNTQARNESAIVEAASLALGRGSESELSAEARATPEPLAPYPDLPDEGCFVATAAFGASWAPQVEVLRAFRDRALAPSALGRRLIRAYYEHGPVGARFVAEHAWLKPLVRAVLWPVVIVALLVLEAPVATALGAGALAALLARRALVRRRMRSAPALLVLALFIAGGPALAQPGGDAPRWMYEIKGGYFYPDLDDYERFYGDDRDTQIAIAGGVKLRPWLELGGEIGHSRDRGAALASGGVVEDAVKLRLVPLHVFATVSWPRDGRRWVPYAGAGLTATWYEQDVELEPGRDGRSDTGVSVRAGVRWFFAEEGARGAAARREGVPYARLFAFFEAQRSNTEVDALDLGGTSYLIGFRAEFELAGRRDRRARD